MAALPSEGILANLGSGLFSALENMLLVGEEPPTLPLNCSEPDLLAEPQEEEEERIPTTIECGEPKEIRLEPFSGNQTDWESWKRTTRARLTRCGLGEVLASRSFATDHPEENSLVYQQLREATMDGCASHVLASTESNKGSDGHRAWESLSQWFEGANDAEVADYLRHRIIYDLSLCPGENPYRYADDFLSAYNRLSGLPGEGGAAMKEGQAKSLFVCNIRDPNYDPLKARLRKGDLSLEEMVRELSLYVEDRRRQRKRRQEHKNPRRKKRQKRKH